MERITLHAKSDSLNLIRKGPLARKLKVSPWTIDRWRKQGTFPEPIPLSDTVLAWRVEDVEHWLADRRKRAARA